MLNTYRLIGILSLAVLIGGCNGGLKDNPDGRKTASETDRSKRSAYLRHLLNTFNSDGDDKPQHVPIWEHWLRTTGELPPAFDKLHAKAFPPELLRFQNGEQVTDPDQWPARKEEIRKILGRYMFGDWPPPPARTAIKYQRSKAAEKGFYKKQKVQLFFAPSPEAVNYVDRNFAFDKVDYSNFNVVTLNADLYIPGGKGPFPAIIELGPAREQISRQDSERIIRGYIVCRYNRKDADLIPAVYVDNSCNQIEWWAYAASRCVDLLYSMDEVDKSKIAIAGHSRSGKTALLAAVMDERINAVIASHPGTGTGSFNLWRYAGEKFGGETLENSTRRFPYWNNPRMRFLIGRENKMPFDSHFLLALLAPRPCLMGTGETDDVGEIWGDQQCYLLVREVYKLLGSEKKLGFYASPGAHEVTPVMIDDYLDWLDLQLGRRSSDFPEKLVYTYSFEEWKKIAGGELNIDSMPYKDLGDLLVTTGGKTIRSRIEWELKADQIKNNIRWIIGDLPAYDKIQTADTINVRSSRNDLVKAEIRVDEKIVAHLTYPADRREKVPVVIYLHAYLDANGYNWSRSYGYSTSVGERLAQKGFLAVEFDQFGYGLRKLDCGLEFFSENKNVSALGVMIQDVRKIIDAISLLDWIDKDKIMVSGYSLGGMVGLYAGVFDKRIHAVATTCGFGSMRHDVHAGQTEGIKRYSHLRPTIPRLGFFVDNETRIPYDFHEVLALIAPRPVLILAPELDQDWYFEDVEICYREAAKIFDLYGKKANLVFKSPIDFNRYPPEYQDVVNNWLAEMAE